MICVFLPSISSTAEVGNLTVGGEGGAEPFLLAMHIVSNDGIGRYKLNNIQMSIRTYSLRSS